MALSLVLVYLTELGLRKVYYDKKKMVQFVSATSLLLLVFIIPLLFFTKYTFLFKDVLLSLLISGFFLFGLMIFLSELKSARFRLQNYAYFILFLSLIVLIKSLVQNPNQLLVLLYLIPVGLTLPFFFSNKLKFKVINIIPALSLIALIYLLLYLANTYSLITALVLIIVSFSFLSQLFNIFYFRNSADILETKNFITKHLFVFTGSLLLFLITLSLSLIAFKEHFALLLLSFVVYSYEKKINKNLMLVFLALFLMFLILFTTF